MLSTASSSEKWHQVSDSYLVHQPWGRALHEKVARFVEVVVLRSVRDLFSPDFPVQEEKVVEVDVDRRDKAISIDQFLSRYFL